MQYKTDSTIKGAIEKMMQNSIAKHGMPSYEARVLGTTEQYSDPEDKNKIVGDTTAGVPKLEIKLFDKQSNGEMGSAGGESSGRRKNDSSSRRRKYASVAIAKRGATEEAKSATKTDGTQKVSNIFLLVEFMDANGLMVQKYVPASQAFGSSPVNAGSVYMSAYDAKNRVVSTDIVAVGMAGSNLLSGFNQNASNVTASTKYAGDTSDYDSIIEHYCKGTNIPPSLAKAILKNESGGDPGAVSCVGAQGLMQLMPETAAELAAKAGMSSYDLKDPETNIKLGIMYLDEIVTRYGYGTSNWAMVVQAYNAGPGAPQNADMAYVNRVISQYNQTK